MVSTLSCYVDLPDEYAGWNCGRITRKNGKIGFWALIVTQFRAHSASMWLRYLLTFMVMGAGGIRTVDVLVSGQNLS